MQIQVHSHTSQTGCQPYSKTSLTKFFDSTLCTYKLLSTTFISTVIWRPGTKMRHIIKSFQMLWICTQLCAKVYSTLHSPSKFLMLIYSSAPSSLAPKCFIVFFFKKKWDIVGLFLVYFPFFKQTIQFMQQKMWKKCPSSIRCRDLNPRPSEHESPQPLDQGSRQKFYSFGSLKWNGITFYST